MEQILGGRLVDAVLWPASRALAPQERPDPPVSVHLADLAGSHGTHDRERLVAALAALLEGQE